MPHAEKLSALSEPFTRFQDLQEGTVSHCLQDLSYVLCIEKATGPLDLSSSSIICAFSAESTRDLRDHL